MSSATHSSATTASGSSGSAATAVASHAQSAAVYVVLRYGMNIKIKAAGDLCKLILIQLRELLVPGFNFFFDCVQFFFRFHDVSSVFSLRVLSVCFLFGVFQPEALTDVPC